MRIGLIINRLQKVLNCLFLEGAAYQQGAIDQISYTAVH